MARALLARQSKRPPAPLLTHLQPAPPAPSAAKRAAARSRTRAALLHLLIVVALVTGALHAVRALVRADVLRVLDPYVAHAAGRRQDPRALQLASLAVRDFLSSAWEVRVDGRLFGDDEENIALLVEEVRMPLVFATRLGKEGRRRLLQRLTVDSNGVAVFEAMPKILIVDVQNGLGNRLRALASAMEFTFFSRRVLVVLWARDAHINATMSDLFDARVLRNLLVIHEPVSWPIRSDDAHLHLAPTLDARMAADRLRRHATAPHAFRYVNLMSKDREFNATAPSARIRSTRAHHLYIKTAYVLQSAWTNGRLVNAFMQALTPAPAVLALVRQAEDRCGGAAALRRMVGVHIRSRTIVHDNDAVDHECEYSVHGAATTDRWRQMSTPEHFIPEMRRIRNNWPAVVQSSYHLHAAGRLPAAALIAAANSDTHTAAASTTGSDLSVDLNTPPRFYVSADSVHTLRSLQASLPAHAVVHLPRRCDDRGAACILYAFADMITLSRSAALLASGWSSFSEAAHRLRVRPHGMDPSRNDGYLVRTSGIDFGGPSRLDAVAHLWKVVQGWLRKKEAWPVDGDQASEAERRRLCRERRENRSDAR